MKTTASRQTVATALIAVNEMHGYELRFNRAEQKGRYFHFTIRGERSNAAGTRMSHSGRRLVSAFWHAHGYLFDEIFRLDQGVKIWSMGKQINVNEGNWEDRNVGSYYSPMMMNNLSLL